MCCRLEKILQQEEKRRKEDASYFNEVARIYNEALHQDKE